jgi:hypothetical protein
LITPTVTHRATIVEPNAVGALLRAIDGFEGQPTTRYALQMAPLVFVRPGELRKAEWTEFFVAEAEWRIRLEDEDETAAPCSARPAGPFDYCRASRDHRQIQISIPLGQVLASAD